MIHKPLPGIVLLLSSILFLAGCSKPAPSVEEGSIQEGVYFSEVLGWKFDYPEGWEVMTAREFQGIENRGKKMVEKTVGGPVTTAETNLINLKKDKSNIFTSASEPFDPYSGTYAEYQQGVFQLLAETFTASGIQFAQTQGKETIDGIEFTTIQFDIKDPQGKVAVTTLVYDALIKGRSFMVSLTNSDDAHRQTLLKAWRASIFEK